MCSLFLFLIFPRSFLLVRYNVSSVVQVFRTRWCIILQIALENVSSLQVKWIRCKCFLRDANKQKSNDVSAGVYRGCGATSNPTSLSPLKRQHYCGVGFIMLKKHRLSFSRRSRPIRYFIPLGSSLKSRRWFSSIFLNKFVDFLPVQNVSCGDRTSRLWLLVQVQISATIPCFYHPMTHGTYVHSIFTTESQ